LRRLLGHLNNSGNRGIGMHRAEIDLEHNRLILHWIDSLNGKWGKTAGE
jgi:hypothetical protein